MTDDIVIRLREKYSGQLPICSEAADEIERLRSQNTELVKMFKQVGVVAEMWQKSEDELIELHHGKCAEQFAKQADEIERLRAMLEEMRLAVISEHRRWCDRPCSAEEWQLHD